MGVFSEQQVHLHGKSVCVCVWETEIKVTSDAADLSQQEGAPGHEEEQSRL